MQLFKRSLIWFSAPVLTISLLSSVSNAQDADLCGLDDVVQPAIDDAADQNGCNAPGVYIAPNTVLDNATEKCRVGFSPSAKCKRCLKEEASKAVNLFKLLIKQRYQEPTSLTEVKRGFASLSQECPPPVESSSSGDNSSVSSAPSSENPGSESHSSNENHSGDDHSGSNSSNQSSSIGSGMPTDDVRDLVDQACPCHGTFNTHDGYMHCVELKLSQLVTNNQVDPDTARLVYGQARFSDCGVPPRPENRR